MAKLDPPGFRQTRFANQRDAEAFLSGITDSVSNFQFNKRDNFHLSYAGATLGACALHRGTHSSLSFEVVRADEYHIVFAQRHVVRFSGAGGTAEADADRTVMLLAPQLEGRCEAASDTTATGLVAPTAALSAHAEKLTGQSGGLRGMPRGAVSLDLANPAVGTLARNVSMVFQEMQALAPTGLSALASSNFDDLLLGLTSAIIWPGMHKRPSGRLAEPASGVVRAAREFIEGHAAEPVRLADLARDLGVGLRALQLGFRRHVGCSPREYLMRCRLQLARARLLAADESTRVATVAFDCGFTDLAIFSVKYRQSFGELPSETLRRRR